MRRADRLFQIIQIMRRTNRLVTATSLPKSWRCRNGPFTAI